MVNKACSAHIEYRESCFKCRKVTALNGKSKDTPALALAAAAAPYVNGYPTAQVNVAGQFKIACPCGLTTETRYLTGTCVCGRVWDIQWDQAKREYEKLTHTHVLSISEQENLR
jgi:hypothetical protein